MHSRIKKTGCILFLLFIHLSAKAGELISIKQSETLRPTISVLLSDKTTEILNSKGFDNAKDILAIYLVNNGTAAQVPVAGTYRIEKNKLFYTPLYELGYDLEFEIKFENETGKAVVRKRFHTPPNPASAIPVNIERMYPLTDTIPYNTLYFHIRFNQPMKDNIQAFKSVKVVDDNGKEITNAWRHKSFWIDDGKLLVLMIHPGRVKNGIHYESPLFDSGKYYTVQVTDGLMDRNGNAVSINFSRQYFVAGEDRKIPEVQLNNTPFPKAGSMEPVAFIFSEGIDNASVLDGVKVLDEQGNNVPCFIREKQSDRVFTITPVKKWKSGHYRIALSGSIYDFAGNRLNRLFEITDINQIEADKRTTFLDFNIQ